MPFNRTIKVLVMDDEELIRSYCSFTLSYLGHKFQVACNGEEALLAYQYGLAVGEPFDAAILDIGIPGGMGGEETIRRLIQIDPGVKAIVSSGYHGSPLMVEYREHGFKAALPKPYSAQELTDALSKVLV